MIRLDSLKKIKQGFRETAQLQSFTKGHMSGPISCMQGFDLGKEKEKK